MKKIDKDIEKALIKKALGYTQEETIEEYSQVDNEVILNKRKVTKKDVSVGIMYSKSREVDALTVKEQLKTMGYEINCTGRSSHIHNSEIVGYNTDVSTEMIKSIQKEIEQIEKLHYVHNPVRNICTESDFVITLADEE